MKIEQIQEELLNISSEISHEEDSKYIILLPTKAYLSLWEESIDKGTTCGNKDLNKEPELSFYGIMIHRAGWLNEDQIVIGNIREVE